MLVPELQNEYRHSPCALSAIRASADAGGKPDIRGPAVYWRLAESQDATENLFDEKRDEKSNQAAKRFFQCVDQTRVSIWNDELRKLEPNDNSQDRNDDQPGAIRE